MLSNLKVKGNRNTAMREVSNYKAVTSKWFYAWRENTFIQSVFTCMTTRRHVGAPNYRRIWINDANMAATFAGFGFHESHKTWVKTPYIQNRPSLDTGIHTFQQTRTLSMKSLSRAANHYPQWNHFLEQQIILLIYQLQLFPVPSAAAVSLYTAGSCTHARTSRWSARGHFKVCTWRRFRLGQRK